MIYFPENNIWVPIVHVCIILSYLQSTKAVYNRIIDLKIATPQIIMNYGLFLEEQNYFEEAFKVSYSNLVGIEL